MSFTVLTTVSLLLASCNAFRPTNMRSNRQFVLKASVDDSELVALENTLYDMINAKFDLKLTDFTDYKEVKTWTAGDYSGNAEWYDEVKGSKLTGVTRCSLKSETSSSFTLNAWLGPSLPVPHFMLTLGKDQAGFHLTSDFVARGAQPIGNDQNFMDNYYPTSLVASTYDTITALEGVTHLPPSTSFSRRLLRSPLQLSVTGLSFEQLSTYATAHTETWIKFFEEVEDVPTRLRGSFNARDDKLRQYAYRASMAEFKDLLVGVDAAKVAAIAAGCTGPISEAYVGGGS